MVDPALTLELEDFDSNDLVPPYAILSHTWGDGEVTFHDWQDRVSRVKKRGFYKIQSTCQQAFLDGYSHAWVDTNLGEQMVHAWLDVTGAYRSRKHHVLRP